METKLVSNKHLIENCGNGVYWIQSFNPKHKQMSYRIIIRADKVSCSCKAFQFNEETLCKHLRYIVEKEVKIE